MESLGNCLAPPRPTSQRTTEPSSPPVASLRPSAANATAQTPPGGPVGLAHMGAPELSGVASLEKTIRARTRRARRLAWAQLRIVNRTQWPALGMDRSSSGEPAGWAAPKKRLD